LNKKIKKPVINLVKAINADEELKAIVSEIHIGTSGVYLKTDQLDTNVFIDVEKDIKGQLYKLKAIYMYLVKNHKNNQYKNMDLRFANQVVCK